jgi:hypothetical protein
MLIIGGMANADKNADTKVHLGNDVSPIAEDISR